MSVGVEDWELMARVRGGRARLRARVQGQEFEQRRIRAEARAGRVTASLATVDRLRASVAELREADVVLHLPSFPSPPTHVDDFVSWWESAEGDALTVACDEATRMLSAAVDSGWRQFLEQCQPALPTEDLLERLEEVSDEYADACRDLRDGLEVWSRVARIARPSDGDVERARRAVEKLGRGWAQLEESGATPEKVRLLSQLAERPVPLSAVPLETIAWLRDTGLAAPIHLRLRGNT